MNKTTRRTFSAHISILLEFPKPTQRLRQWRISLRRLVGGSATAEESTPTDYAPPVGERPGWPACPTANSGCVSGSRLDLFIIIVITLSVVLSGTSAALAAAEASPDKAVAESPSEQAQGDRRLLPSLMGATPEDELG